LEERRKLVRERYLEMVGMAAIRVGTLLMAMAPTGLTGWIITMK
jgi:hypothetical protein